MTLRGEGRWVIEKTGQRNYHINNVPTTTLTTAGAGDPRSNSDFSGFFIHELAHHATGFTDARLVAELRLIQNKGDSASTTLDKYFNNDCPANMIKPRRSATPRSRRRR